MAVIDKSKQTAVHSDAAETKKEGERNGRTVNLLEDKSLPSGKKSKLDITEDAWEYSAPPKPGRFSLKLFLAKDGVTCYDDDPNREPSYGIAMEAKIVNSANGEYDNVTVFPRVSTGIARGKNLSTAAGLLVKLGYKVPSEADDKTIAILVVQALKKEPVTDVELDWNGYSKLEKREVYKGMLAFPTDEHGEHLHIVEYKTKGQIEEIRAQLKVVHWYGKGETGSVNKGTRASTSAASATGAAGPVLISPATNEPDSTVSVQIASKPQTSDEDLVTLLEEA